MKKRGLFTRKKKYIPIIIFVLVLVVILLIVQNIYLFKTLKGSEEKSETSYSAIIDKLSKNDFIAGETPVKITQLDSKTLQELKEEYPTIYGEAHEGFYEIRYPSWFVIYDADNDQIIKKYRFQSINLN